MVMTQRTPATRIGALLSAVAGALDDDGAVSLGAATGVDVVAAPAAARTQPVRIEVAKASVDLAHGIIFGVASTTTRDDLGDWIDADTLETAAYRFMEKQAVAKARATDTHDFGDIPGTFVASWVERIGDHATWSIGFKPIDRQVAVDAANGEFVGWSIGGMADYVEE